MNLRDRSLENLSKSKYDVLIIGGGINGAVSAAALSAHGAKVALIDSRDFAGFTSQHSSNLVWGGIKYMEGYEFGLVNGLCKSRNELLDRFPSTVKEIRFLMTVRQQFKFHPWIILASTWLYWLFGRGRTKTPSLLSRRQIKQSEPLIDIETSRGGIEYSDAFLHDNDARFVFNFIRSAIDNGCTAANYVAASKSMKVDGGWKTQVKNQITGDEFSIQSKIIINAAGAYVDEYNQRCEIETSYRHLFSKGIHLIVPKISNHHRVLAFFADDDRLFFAIPMANRTCIGTTDTRVSDPATSVSKEDRDFVLTNINARLDLDKPLTRDDVIAERCGVRPLAVKKGSSADQDFLQLSRKHVIETNTTSSHISIFGGKLTDCLNVGEEICETVSLLGVKLKPLTNDWYGEPDKIEHQRYLALAKDLGIDHNTAQDTGEELSERLWRRYGRQAFGMLEAIKFDMSLSEPLIENTGFRLCEIDHMAEREMIVNLEDFLRRRSKIELIVSRDKLKNSAGLMTACKSLFGDEAEQKFNAYFDLNK